MPITRNCIQNTIGKENSTLRRKGKLVVRKDDILLRSSAADFIEWDGQVCKWKSGKFIVADVSNEIRVCKEKVAWCKLVWNNTVPKHAVIAWMVILGRVPTFDRLKKWVIIVDDKCVLCNCDAESRNHLFFECSFSNEIWSRVLSLCGLQRSVRCWKMELAWAAKKFKGKALYHIWRERNNRHHGKSTCAAEHVLDQIVWDVRVRLSSLRKIKADAINRKIVHDWLLADTMFC